MQKRFLALTLSLAGSLNAAPVDYASDVQPILEDRCADCHAGADPDGEFALDTLEALLKGGKAGPAIEPGKAQDSLLVKFLEGRSGKTGKNQFMPPGKKEHLKPEQIGLIRRWIDEGARGSAAPANPLAMLPKVKSESTVKPVHAVAASAATKIIALGKEGAVDLIDSTSHKLLRQLRGIAGKPSALRFDSAGNMLFVAAGEPGISGVAYQLRAADGKLLRTFEGHRDALYALALSPDGKRLATGGYDQSIRLWDIASGKLALTITGHNGCIHALTFRPDGKVLASASADRTVKLWNPDSGARLNTFQQPLKEQLAAIFSADGKTLFAAGGDSRIRSWRVSESAAEGTNALLETKFAHEGSVIALELSPDGRTFLSSASDRTVRLWDVATFAQKSQFPAQPDWVPALAWLDATHAVAARLDGSVAIIDTATGKAAPLTADAPAAKPPAKPELIRLLPRGFQSGTETTITATGKGLARVKQIKASDPRIVASKLEAKGTSLTFTLTTPKDLPRGEYSISVVTAGGETSKLKLFADTLPQTTTTRLFDLGQSSINIWGTLAATGQRDEHRFKARAGITFVLDLAAKRVDSKAQTIQLELFDAAGKKIAINHGLDAGSDPLIAYQPKQDGEFIARVSETTLEGSADHAYRLTITNHAYVTGWWPLSVPVNKDTRVHLIGYELHGASLLVHPTKPGVTALPPLPADTRYRQMPSVVATAMNEVIEREPNDDIDRAEDLQAPISINGRLFVPNDSESADTDVFAFDARSGEQWMIETVADKAGTPADTRIEVLHADGSPVERLRLQAVRSSFNNFRGVDADNPDIRLENYTETGLNEFVYFNGDIMRTFRLPRGPDGGFFFYTSQGKRRAWFDTTATGHALDEPCYVVTPLKPGDSPLPNGLPVLSLSYANDDDGLRKLGRDSRLHFTAPASGRYLIRVTDSRGWSGDRFAYRLVIRQPTPDFAVKLSGENMTVGAGSAMGFSLRADRQDDFEEPITVTISGLPQGWYASSPITIEAGHTLASGSLYASANATTNADWSKVSVQATSGNLRHPVNGFGKVVLGAKPKFVPELEPAANNRPVARTSAEPQIITIKPGEIVSAFIRVARNGSNGILNFDVHSLPHGVIVDDIGLNGIQVREKESEREIRFACATWVRPQERLIHAAVSSARNEADSAALATSYPVLLRVVPR